MNTTAISASPISKVDDSISVASPISLKLTQVLQSVAYATECPIAVFYLQRGSSLEPVASFGVDATELPAVPASNTLLVNARSSLRGGLSVINDVNSQIDSDQTGSNLLGQHLPPLRFVAATSIWDSRDVAKGILLVGSYGTQAGLSGAKQYIIIAHASQLSALLELTELRTLHDSAEMASPSSLASERLRLLESVVVNANDAVLITQAEPIDLPGPKIVYCNAAFTRATGYLESDVLGLTPRILQSPKTDRRALDRLRAALAKWEPVEVELLNRRKDGTEFQVELSIVPVANEKGWFTHWVSVQRDVSERKIAEEAAIRARIAEAENLILEAEIHERKKVEVQLTYTAFHDELTKLYNRAFFMERLAVAAARAKIDPGFHYAVLFADLDRFKLVNDSLGHRAGDLLLMEVATRMRECLRPQDTIARLGGDEFAFLVEGDNSVLDVTNLAERLIATVSRSLWLGKQEVFPSCSIGLVWATAHYKDPEDLLRDADLAMYQAKRRKAGSYAVFADPMHTKTLESLELDTDLKNAVDRREFSVHYQPICNLGTGIITGLEALIRWTHPERGLIAPSVFIPTAESTGLIRAIGQWVLLEACTHMTEWRNEFPGMPLTLNVNTSSVELRNTNFIVDVQAILAATQTDARDLQLEITESIFIEQPDLVGRILDDIRKLGVRIALDDFGTGYSSLSYLDRYPMDTIKIDRSFIDSMLHRSRTMAIVETVVRLAAALDLKVVAEGVEDHQQLHVLREIGCDSVQGYLLGHPIGRADTHDLLAKQYDSLSQQSHHNQRAV